MKFAIIAAGEGSRLAEEGVALPKPLVELQGKAMIDRLVGIFIDNGAEEIVMIVNEQMKEVRSHVETLAEMLPVPLRLVVKSTPSSMHSFYELREYLHGDRFCLTTVDTIFRPEEFGRYIDAFKQSELDGMMAVTDYIDDEKPLYVGTDETLRITGFYDGNADGACRYISGGIYCLTSRALETLEGCMAKGMARMRNFQRQLVDDGLQLKAYPFSKILDVDHASDIEKAESFLHEQ